MPGPEFHQTGYGRRFFEGQLPELIKGLHRLAAALEPELRTKEESEPWENNELQFARLVCEITATGGDPDMLMQSMDLEPDELTELLDRAREVWEEAKEQAFQKSDRKEAEFMRQLYADGSEEARELRKRIIEYRRKRR